MELMQQQRSWTKVCYLRSILDEDCWNGTGELVAQYCESNGDDGDDVQTREVLDSDVGVAVLVYSDVLVAKVNEDQHCSIRDGVGCTC